MMTSKEKHKFLLTQVFVGNLSNVFYITLKSGELYAGKVEKDVFADEAKYQDSYHILLMPPFYSKNTDRNLQPKEKPINKCKLIDVNDIASVSYRSTNKRVFVQYKIP